MKTLLQLNRMMVMKNRFIMDFDPEDCETVPFSCCRADLIRGFIKRSRL